MSIENYAVHRVSPNSKCDIAVTEIIAARNAAYAIRAAFNKEHGAVGAYCNDNSVTGLLFEKEPLPSGWRSNGPIESNIIGVPDKKTKLGKELAKKLKSLPPLPGVREFTLKIGGDLKIVSSCIRHCWFERIGDSLFVMTPWESTVENDFGDEEPSAKTRIAFLPEECERVPYSVYYAAKETVEAEKVVV